MEELNLDFAGLEKAIRRSQAIKEVAVEQAKGSWQPDESALGSDMDQTPRQNGYWIQDGTETTVDGVILNRLPTNVFQGSKLRLPTPIGTHWIRSAGESASRSYQGEGFRQTLTHLRQQLSDESGLSLDLTLFHASRARAMNDPMVWLLLGDFYWDLDEAEAAVRFWNAAVLVQPSFAP
ncbi:MAG: hypothetical protein AAGD07_20170, partial [Planctomycetota bacterium]